MKKQMKIIDVLLVGFVAAYYAIRPSTGIVYKYMSTSPNDDGNKPTPPDKSTVILLLSTMGDTTWRMFVPTIGATIIGLIADKALHTTPWLMIAAMLVGVGLAVFLVRAQLNKVKQ